MSCTVPAVIAHTPHTASTAGRPEVAATPRPTAVSRLSAMLAYRYDLSPLRSVWHVAEPCPPWLKHAWIEWLGAETVWELYGGTEAQAGCTINGREWLSHEGSVGRPVWGEVYMRPVPGDPASYRYIGASARVLDGWESLGDLGELDEDGYLYLHFRSKFDVFLAVYEEGMRRVRDRVEPHTHGDGTGHDRLVAMSVAHVTNLMTDVAYHNVVHQGVRAQASADLKVRQRDALLALNELRRDYERMFHTVVAKGVEDGSLRGVDTVLAARTVLSSLNAVDTWYRRIDGQSEEDVHELASQVVDLVVGGVAARR
ncbi:AMP-binding protein [Nocardiopsis sp. NPDC058631]|uniref:AMP-binding protein n=1 Tax=Nocardiopsis sp. NPDC058631 TaxID=3346566 RepID=UPI0036503BD5